MRRITKSQLARILGYYSPKSGRTYTNRLREKEFTDTILTQLGIDPKEYPTIKTFSAIQTRKIVQLFAIEETDLV